ncbi:MAG TPA: hypothetical protein VFU98_18695 [Microlunatus sp.]|nr:hypothetical protein [Microlunatus sp.]
MAAGQNKAMRISIGLLLMAGFVMILFGLITRYAGGWGVPYFSFTSDRGSPCVNKLTGYVCEPLTLADVQFYSDAELPADTKVVSGAYTATHDYTLRARLEVPRASAAVALKGLTEEFGGCVPGHPVPMETTQLSAVCVLANDDAVTRQGEPPSRLYVIGTGIRADDGTRVIDLSIRSR